MGFSYTGYKPKVPSMESYSSNIPGYDYIDKVLDAVGITNNDKVENVSLEVNNESADVMTSYDMYTDVYLDGLKRTGATVAVGILSLGEGVLSFGESLLDAGVMFGTVLRTPGTFLVDKIFGTHHTEKMWEDTRAFVSHEYVHSMEDSFYNNTAAGQALKNNAYAFDTVRSVGNEIGYVTGVVGLSVLTFGVGTAGVGAAEAGSIGLSEGMGILAGTAGFGRQTEKAWNSGATTAGGLASGALGGAWEGLLFWTGGKVAGLTPTLSRGLNAALRIEANMGLGGADAFVRPVINSVASGKGYVESFQENGGFKSVLAQMLVAGGFSGFGELGLRNRIQFGGVKSKIKGPIDPNLRTQLIDEFDNLFTAEGGNHALAVDYYRNIFENTDNPEALRILASIIETKRQNPEFILTTSGEGWQTSFFSSEENRINITRNNALGGRGHVGMHEAGHSLFRYKLNSVLPEEWDEVAARARVFNSNQGTSARNDFFIELVKRRTQYQTLGAKEFESRIGIGTNWASYDDYFNFMFERNKAELAQQHVGVYLKNIGVGDEILNNGAVQIDDAFIRDVTTRQIEGYKSNIAEDMFAKEYSDYSALSDIVDSLYLGTRRDIKLNPLSTRPMYVHTTDYYAHTGGSAQAANEMIANYTQLRTTGSERSIQMLRQMCGDEFVDTLEGIYQKLR